MQYTISIANKTEFHNTENLTRETFWNLYTSGCTEHFILHNLRKSDSYIKELDIVLRIDSKIIGHSILSKAIIESSQKNEYDSLILGPISIDKNFQKKGFGSKLIEYSILKAKELNYKGILLFGSPDYYRKFGFINAQTYSISTEDGSNFDAFMALELYDGSLKNYSGRLILNSAFVVNESDFEQYDIRFPRKEKGEPQIKI